MSKGQVPESSRKEKGGLLEGILVGDLQQYSYVIVSFAYFIYIYIV